LNFTVIAILQNAGSICTNIPLSHNLISSACMESAPSEKVWHSNQGVDSFGEYRNISEINEIIKSISMIIVWQDEMWFVTYFSQSLVSVGGVEVPLHSSGNKYSWKRKREKSKLGCALLQECNVKMKYVLSPGKVVKIYQINVQNRRLMY